MAYVVLAKAAGMSDILMELGVGLFNIKNKSPSYDGDLFLCRYLNFRVWIKRS